MTMGAYLRDSRRRRRISIERAAEETRIRADFLMRMESDELDFMAPAYVRGFLKSYARFLRVDPAPLLAEFDGRFGTGPVDTSEIIALNKRNRLPPRRRLAWGRWGVTAALAAAVILLLTIIGLAMGPDESDRTSGAAASPSPSPRPTTSPRPTATPTPTTTSLFAEGIEVRVVAVSDRCYLEVDADGERIFTGILEPQQAEEFTADRNMAILFGKPDAVELIVNGKNVGSPSRPGEGEIVVRLPRDYKRLAS